MNSIQRAELEEILVAYFDAMVRAAMDESTIPPCKDDQEYMTERFIAATGDERADALAQYPAAQLYLVRRFKSYVEEERDHSFGEGLLGLDDDLKCEIMQGFAVWYGTMSLRDFLSDKNCSFNPLYLTEWCDGLAVMYVQNERLLREKIFGALLEGLFLEKGMPTNDFLMLPFTMQLEFYKTNQELIAAILHALGNSQPEVLTAPVG